MSTSFRPTPSWMHGMTEEEWRMYRPLDSDAMRAEPVLRATRHTEDFPESFDRNDTEPRGWLDRIRAFIGRWG